MQQFLQSFLHWCVCKDGEKTWHVLCSSTSTFYNSKLFPLQTGWVGVILVNSSKTNWDKHAPNFHRPNRVHHSMYLLVIWVLKMRMLWGKRGDKPYFNTQLNTNGFKLRDLRAKHLKFNGLIGPFLSHSVFFPIVSSSQKCVTLGLFVF